MGLSASRFGGKEGGCPTQAAQRHFFNGFQAHVTSGYQAIWLEIKERPEFLFIKFTFSRANVHRRSWERGVLFLFLLSSLPLPLPFFPERPINSLTTENDNPSGRAQLHSPTQEKPRPESALNLGYHRDSVSQSPRVWDSCRFHMLFPTDPLH